MGYLSCKTESSVITCKSLRNEIEPAKLRTFRYKELEAATKGFSRELLIGKGSYGWVYKGLLKDGTLVAIKRTCSARKSLQDESPLENELEVLSKIRSPRLVNLVGFSRDNKETVLVVDFMANGTLYDVLHSRMEPLGWSVRLQIALQIAKGLRALHTATPPVIHRDVKSSNVLIDSEWNAKLSDFGLALRGRIEDVIRLSTPPAGTMGYLDPGYVSPGHLSTKTDVFSFGILLLEIMSGRNAIDVQYYPPNIVDWALPLIRQGQGAAICDPKSRHPTNAEAINQMAGVAARCVRLSSSRRPSMAEVVKELRDVSRRINLPGWNSLVKPIRPSLEDRTPRKKQAEVAACATVQKRKEQVDVAETMQALRNELGHRKCCSSSSGASSSNKVIVPAARRARVRMIYAEDSLKQASVPAATASARRKSLKMAEYLV